MPANLTHFRNMAFLLVVLFSVGRGMAQVTTGSIAGLVMDQARAVLPGVGITARNVETNLQRTVISDDEGRYRLLNLDPGTYEVKAELAGFKTAVRTGVELTIGREALLDITLGVGELTEQVTVSGDAPLVETTSGTLGALVSGEAIQDLPLNGRSFQELMGLQLGVVLPTKTTSQPSQGMGKKFSVGGARFSFNQFLLDGAEINDARDSTPASVAGTLMGVEAVREFKVLTNSYSAEYGRSAGAVISIATKSGTNKFHGSIYEFLRNNVLDARNFFTPGSNLPFKRNQYGMEGDGPIFKNRTFFVVNYEGLRQRLQAPSSLITLDAGARQGVLPGRPPVQVDADIKPFLDLYPLPTPGGRNFGNGTAEFLSPAATPIDEDYFTLRVDHELSQSHSLFGRYTRDEGNSSSVRGFNLFLNLITSRSKNVVLQERAILTPTLINTAMLLFNRPEAVTLFVQARKLTPSFTVFERHQFGSLGVTGLDTLGDSFDENLRLGTLEVSDNLAYSKGDHALKFGGTVKRLYYNHLSEDRLGGSWSFASIPDLLANRPSQLLVIAPGFDLYREERQGLFGFYLQDDWSVRRGLTFNLGLRYEFITVPYEKKGKQANLVSLYDRSLHLGKPFFNNPSLRNFAPRFGFAWDLLGDGKAVLRGGFGIFHGQVLPRVYERTMRYMPPFYNLAVLAPPPPLPLDARELAALQSLPLSQTALQTTEYNLSTPYMMQYNLTVQREILPNTVLTVAYVGSRGVHLPRKLQWNIPLPQIQNGQKFFPAPGPAGVARRNPNFSSIQHVQNDANSVYNSFQLGVNRRMSDGLQFQANYTFSRAIDTASDIPENAFGGSVHAPQDPDNRNDMRALSDFHIQHNFVVNTSYKFPWADNLSGVAAKLAGNWEIAGIAALASGAPFGVELGFDRARTGETTGQRPNLGSGYSNNPVLGGPNQYFDVNAFELQPAGFLGNIGRNTIRGPGLTTVDVSLLKNIAITKISEQFRVQFRAEFFNLLNHANFASPRRSGPGGIQPLNRLGERLPGAARLTQTATTSRQIQLALKILF